MKKTPTLLACAALLMAAPMAIAQGCSGYGHAKMTMAEAEPAEEMLSIAADETTLMASLDCSALEGAELASCTAKNTAALAN